MKKIVVLFAIINLSLMNAQETNDTPLPYEQIPDAPENYTAGTVVSRTIDGLGFRYYWATSELSEADLQYKPSASNRTIAETIDHLHSLSEIIYNSAVNAVNDFTVARDTSLTYEAKRKMTLFNFKKASDIFKKAEDLSAYQIVFKNENGNVEFPFWFQINGPIEDAIWHSGQIVALRRAAGNPLPSGVNVLLGKRVEN